MAARKDKRKGWIVDFVFQHADGRSERVRRRSPVQTRRGAEDFERRLRQEMLNPRPQGKEAPLFRVFAEEFFSGYVVANNKHAERLSKRSILNHHLLPAFGGLRLSAIGLREVELYKARKLRDGLAPKSINNHLTVLRRLLAVAAEWGQLGSVPAIKWLKAPAPEFDFLEFEEADRLVSGADPGMWRTMVLLALRTGLRQGELLALRWEDVDLVAGRLVVRRNLAKGVVGTPKSGRAREVPLSDEARAALKVHRHLRGRSCSVATVAGCSRPPSASGRCGAPAGAPGCAASGGMWPGTASPRTW
jgi:integrase